MYPVAPRRVLDTRQRNGRPRLHCPNSKVLATDDYAPVSAAFALDITGINASVSLYAT
jgi:hypothetical protein